MIVYRLAKEKYKNDLSGKGAELYGGRWNSKGVPIVYTCDSIALCNVEVAVRIPLGIIPSDYFLIHIELPKTAKLKKIAPKDFPKNWNAYPHTYATQQLGDQFAHKLKHLAYKVPSAAVQGNYNYLLNPLHPQMKEVKITKVESYSFDKRLFVR